MKFAYYYKINGKEKKLANITVAWQLTNLPYEEFCWLIGSDEEVQTKDGGLVWREEA